MLDNWGKDQHEIASLPSYGHISIYRSFIGGLGQYLATNYAYYCSRRSTTGDFRCSERDNRFKSHQLGKIYCALSFLCLPIY